jgi:PKD repeat protein
VTHEYESGGNYTVTLIVTDNDNTKAIEQITIYVNELPVPMINVSLPVYIHEVVYFNANQSYDLDGEITEYFWDFGDGTNQTGINVSHVYTEKKTYEVTLTVTDDVDAKGATSGDVYVLFRTYEVNWDIWDVQHFVGSGYLNEGNSWEDTKNISAHNMTQLRWNLTWDDDIRFSLITPNDAFTINITSPTEDEYAGGPETDQQIVLYTPKTSYFNKLPDDGKTYQAESAEVVKTYLAENFTTSAGIGDWEINVTLTEAGGLIELPIGEDTDDGNDWNLNVDCYYYTPVITKL